MPLASAHVRVHWYNERGPTSFAFGGLIKALRDHLKNDVIKACKSKGSLIIFDSRMSHEITPVKSGVRYSLVKWYHGDKPLR